MCRYQPDFNVEALRGSFGIRGYLPRTRDDCGSCTPPEGMRAVIASVARRSWQVGLGRKRRLLSCPLLPAYCRACGTVRRWSGSHTHGATARGRAHGLACAAVVGPAIPLSAWGVATHKTRHPCEADGVHGLWRPAQRVGLPRGRIHATQRHLAEGLQPRLGSDRRAAASRHQPDCPGERCSRGHPQTRRRAASVLCSPRSRWAS
jgi:hypothetical protein